MPMTFEFSCEVVHKKNYENPLIFVSYGEKIGGTFLCEYGVGTNHRTIITQTKQGRFNITANVVRLKCYSNHHHHHIRFWYLRC